MLGHPKPCLELMLQKYSLSDDAKCRERVLPTSFTLYRQTMITKETTLKQLSLWQIYFSSIISNDLVTCFEGIKQYDTLKLNDRCMEIGKLFAHVENKSLDGVPSIDSLKVPVKHAPLLSKIHFVAMIMISAETFIRTAKKENLAQILEMTSYCVQVMDHISPGVGRDESKEVLSILKTYVMNNHALCLIANGKNLEALSFIHQATHSSGAAKVRALKNGYYLQLYFNLTLLLIKLGLHNQATRVWVSLKSLKLTFSDRDFELRQQFDFLDVKMQRYDRIGTTMV